VPSSVCRFLGVPWPDLNILSMAWETSFAFFDFNASPQAYFKNVSTTVNKYRYPSLDFEKAPISTKSACHRSFIPRVITRLR